MRNIIHSLVKYCKESYDELVHKVSWPSSSELARSTVIVVEASILIALIVFAMDFVFDSVMNGIIYPHN